jgi:hypothetical protein
MYSCGIGCLYENLDFFTLLQKKKYLKRYISANMIIVLLFPIARFADGHEEKKS